MAKRTAFDIISIAPAIQTCVLISCKIKVWSKAITQCCSEASPIFKYLYMI